MRSKGEPDLNVTSVYVTTHWITIRANLHKSLSQWVTLGVEVTSSIALFYISESLFVKCGAVKRRNKIQCKGSGHVLSNHVAVNGWSCKTFRPCRSSSVTVWLQCYRLLLLRYNVSMVCMMVCDEVSGYRVYNTVPSIWKHSEHTIECNKLTMPINNQFVHSPRS